MTLLFAAAAAAIAMVGATPTFPSTDFLGTCLDAAWAADTAVSLGVSLRERGDDGRLVHPLLSPALQFPRYRVRTILMLAEACKCVW
jgi:hypothetical protein